MPCYAPCTYGNSMVTDTQTHTCTHDDTIYCASVASHDKNDYILIL